MSEWVKCSERMPPLDQYVLVYLPDRPWNDRRDDPKRIVAMRIYYWEGYSKEEADRLKQWNNDGKDHCWATFGTLGHLNDGEPSHWAPIPPSPTTDGQDR